MQREGPPVPATAIQGPEARRFEWAEASVWTERMVSALGNGVKGGKWYSLMDKVYAPATLNAAWAKVRANQGAAGVDGQSIEKFEVQADKYLSELSDSLRQGTYRPHAIKRTNIPKGDGRMRPLGIPVVKDRIVQTAMKFVLEPIFESEFRPESYGFRPGRGCKDALREVDRLLVEGHAFVVDADLESYFDSIPHEPLMKRLEAKVSDGRVLDLVRSWLAQEIVEDMKRWTPTGGTPQGAVISPLLANIYLHPLDTLMAASGYRMIRYADDFVVLCKSRQEAEDALVLVRDWVQRNGLKLHPEKTQLGDCRKRGEGFDFLGYRFEAGLRLVRKKSLAKLRDTIRAKTKRTCGKSLAHVIAELNRTMIGWYGYFKHAHPSILETIDKMIRRRLRAILRKQEKHPGFGKSLNDHRKWPNAFFAEQGLFTLTGARHAARHSR